MSFGRGAGLLRFGIAPAGGTAVNPPVCVRYTLHKTDAALAAIAKALGRKLPPPEWVQPRFNVTLTHVMPVVATAADGPEVRAMMWGLVPFYAQHQPRTQLLHNAKSETAATLPSFRQAVAQRRCLVPANGFYEWLTQGKLKRPHLFTRRDEEPFAFAGLWEPAVDDRPETYCILTTRPNDLVAPIHTRMPVLLTQTTMPRWLGSEPLSTDAYRELTEPLPADRMQVREVSRFMSNSRNEGPQCLEPPEAAPPPEPELF